MTTMKVAPQLCPNCGAGDWIPILYGFPGEEAMEASKRGEVALGGCVIGETNPTRECKRCGTRWGHERL